MGAFSTVHDFAVYLHVTLIPHVSHILKHLVLIHVFVRRVSILRSNSPPPMAWPSPSPTQNLPDPPVFLPSPSSIMIWFCFRCSYWVAQIQLQTSITPPPIHPPNIAFSDPPVFFPPPLEIIMAAAQWIGVKLWSLGRGCCHYLPIFPCALRGGFFMLQNLVQ